MTTGTITLVHGDWQTTYRLDNPAGTRLTVHESTIVGPAALGDLDGDGMGDAAVVLAFNGGGSGTFIRLVPVLFVEGRPVPGKFVSLRDRVAVRSVTIDAGTVKVPAVVHRIGDGLCCPTLPLVLEFELRDNVLQWRNREVCAGLCADPIGATR